MTLLIFDTEASLQPKMPLFNQCFYFSILVWFVFTDTLCDPDQPQICCIPEDDFELLTLLPPHLAYQFILKAIPFQSIHVNLPRVLHGCLAFHHLCI